MRAHRVRTMPAMVRIAREFFDVYLTGIITLAEANIREPEDEEERNKVPGRRLGKKERVAVDFGDYSLTIDSSDREPPLGLAMLFDRRDGSMVQGPIDAATWERIAEKIRKNPPRKEHHHHVYVGDVRQPA